MRKSGLLVNWAMKNKGAVAQLMESIDRNDSPFICGASEDALKVSLTARFFLLEA